ncbi:MAG: multidrug effflux MFS transporter [Alphaproteobacteria bacterium]
MSAYQPPAQDGRQSLPEFIAMVALLISMVALTIDAMLPALPAIGRDLAVPQANDTQLVVSVFFLGFGLGQMIYGPISDSLGRKPVIICGLLVFGLGCVLSMTASDYTVMLIGRVLQGLGVAGPRIVTIAIVRDRYAGRGMARIMSFVMAVFIIVPAVAPSLGQGIMHLADWRAIFFSLIALGLIGGLWMQLRLEETLTGDNRAPLSVRRVWAAVLETLRTRVALGYTIAGGFIFGAFVGYLSMAQQVFQTVYGVGDDFPLFFAVLALSIGASSVVNAKLVMRLGMRFLSFLAVFALTVLSAGFALAAFLLDGGLPFLGFMAWGVLSFFWVGLLFGNLNALAMEPLGHIAGTAASVIGAGSTLLSIVFGVMVGQAFDGTTVPLLAGFAVLGLGCGLTMLITNRGLGGGPVGDSDTAKS